MKYQRVGKLGAAATVTAIALLQVGAGPAQAHTPSAVASCYGLDVEAAGYSELETNNAVTVTIDGTTFTNTFGGDFSRSYPWSGDEAHEWSVFVDFNRVEGEPTMHDYRASGTSEPCEAPPTTTVPEPTTTVPEPTTTVPEPTTTVPEPTTTVPEPTTTVPGSSTTVPEPTTTSPETTVPAPSTTDVAVLPPVPGQSTPPTPAPAATPAPAPTIPGTLPVTGSSTASFAAAALLLLGAGALALIISRRGRATA